MSDTTKAIHKAQTTLQYLGGGGELNEEQAERFMYWAWWHMVEQMIAGFRWWNWILTPWRIPRQLKLRKDWREKYPDKKPARMMVTKARPPAKLIDGRLDLPREDAN